MVFIDPESADQPGNQFIHDALPFQTPQNGGG